MNNPDMYKAPITSTYRYETVERAGKSWQPGFFRRIPWLGLTAMLGAILGVLGAVAVLYLSNNKPVQDWSVQPTVYLAIASAAINIFLHFALAEAVTTTWWRRALKQQTTVADLHRCWEHGQSLWVALTSGRKFSLVALASILVALGPINGPLLQRASRIRQGYFERAIDLHVNIASELPEGYTGYLSTRGHNPNLLTPSFVQVAQRFNQNSSIIIADSGCKGSCTAQLRGAGLVANCSTSDSPLHLSIPEDMTGQEEDEEVQNIIQGTDIFGTYFLWSGNGLFNLGVQHKSTKDCLGTLVVRNCTFRPATVTYPITINGNASSISLGAGTTIFDDKVNELLPYPLDEGRVQSSLNISTYGGFFKSLSDTYSSTMRMNYGSIGFQIFNEGALSNRYVDSGILETLNCTMSFRDPTDDIIAGIRELFFRTAIAAANGTRPADVQHVTAQESLETPIYTSSYRFLALAVLFSLLGWLATLPLFMGWWRLGRGVSLSPIETAKAFGAPGLRTRDSNARVQDILREAGDRGVRYGVTTTTEGTRLMMGEPSYVRSPNAGERFGG
ncbi:MAG: hypothetical protein Q9184_006900 [Pyrenodesmia sp. 2 TL-2023]